MQRYNGNIISLVGPPFIGLNSVPGVGLEASGVTVTVKTFPGLALASIFLDDGLTMAVNPIVVPSTGDFHFYAANGHYSLFISKTGILNKEISDIILFDFSTFVFTEFDSAVRLFNNGTPASVPANSTSYHDVDVTPADLEAGDFVHVINRTAQFGLGIVGCDVFDSNTIRITYMNTTSSGIVPTPDETYILVHLPLTQ